MSKPDGGPAFPSEETACFQGMTLRDHFAAQALTGVIVHPNATNGSPQQVATVVYQIADAMLAERDK